MSASRKISADDDTIMHPFNESYMQLCKWYDNMKKVPIGWSQINPFNCYLMGDDNNITESQPCNWKFFCLLTSHAKTKISKNFLLVCFIWIQLLLLNLNTKKCLNHSFFSIKESYCKIVFFFLSFSLCPQCYSLNSKI